MLNLAVNISPDVLPSHESELNLNADIIPGPVTGQVISTFTVIPASKTTLQEADRQRIAVGGTEAIGILYDVSPPASSQKLFDQLALFPHMIVCDHHGGAAPAREAPGRELTGAEQVVESLQRLWQEGLLQQENGEPVKLVGVTNSINIDPDSLICRLLIESFCDEKLRQEIWNPRTLKTLLDAARFGDTTFFGGIDAENLSYEHMPEHMRLAFVIFQLINESRADFVVDALFPVAVLRNNLATLYEMNGRPERIPFIKEALRQGDSIETFLRVGCEDAYLTPSEVENDLQSTAHIASLEPGSASASDIHRRLKNNFVLANVSRRDVREVFTGRTSADNIFHKAHAPLFDPAAVSSLFARISAQLPDVLRSAQEFRGKVETFASDLSQVHQAAKQHSRVIGESHHQVTLTRLSDRLDRQSDRPQHLQRFPIWDWLREASASFGDPWLHVMDRRGQFVVSSRFARNGEERPDINLADPVAVAALNQMEKNACTEGENPASFLVKANLWLPLGKVHFSQDNLLNLIETHFDRIVSRPSSPATAPLDQPLMPTVMTTSGQPIVFDGTHHFRVARIKSTDKALSRGAE